MAGQEGFEPPTPGFGDRCSSQAELLAYPGLGPGLPGFLVDRVLPATGAELLPLHAVGMQPLVLRVRVVALLALVASERDRVAHVALPYWMISVTTPAPTVRPPSRIAKRSSFSIAIGVISSTVMSTLSPGITISRPSGNVPTPVTSVVRK